MGTIQQSIFNKTSALRKYVGEDFVAASAFVTYLIRQNKDNNEYSELTNYWSSADICRSVTALDTLSLKYKNDRDNENYLLSNALIDINQTLIFFGNSPSCISKNFRQNFLYFVNNITNSEIAFIVEDYLLRNNKNICNTSTSVSNLARALLKIKSNESVADLCCGQGVFLSRVNESNNLYGCDVNFDYLLNAYAICSVKGKNVKFEQQDVLTRKGSSFDKIFMEYPWGYIYQRPLDTLRSDRWFPLPISNLKRSMTSWLFISKALSFLNKNGIAVIHVNDGALSSTYENEIRNKAIEMGLVKAVIALPPKINSYTNIRTSLLVLSFNNNDVRFIDASNIDMEKGDKQNKIINLTEKDINTICSLIDNKVESNISTSISISDLLRKGGNLDVYFSVRPETNIVKIANGKKIDDIKETFIKSVIMNSHYLTTDSETNIRVLSSSDINDGYVDVASLPYLSNDGMSHLIGKWKENILKDGDVVMTNKSTTIKSAVINTNGEEIVLFGSLMAIRPLKDVTNPDYLSAFINSKAGQSLLKDIQTGATIQMITLNNLKELNIPCPSLDKQNEFVKDIKITLQMIREYKERTLSLQNQYESSFDNLFVEE